MSLLHNHPKQQGMKCKGLHLVSSVLILSVILAWHKSSSLSFCQELTTARADYLLKIIVV